MIFVCWDVVALVVQAVGGGIASGNSTSDATTGGNIMLAGIVIQLGSLRSHVFSSQISATMLTQTPLVLSVAILTYTGVATEFLYRLYNDLPVREPTPSRSVAEKASHGPRLILSTRVQLMLAALAFSSLVLLIRAIYRTIELAVGWNGRIIETEVYFNVLDGGMVVLSMYTINIFHPGWLLESNISQGVDSDSDMNIARPSQS